MSPRECGNCARPVPDGAGICRHCATALATTLRGAPELLDNLFITYSKCDHLGAAGGGKRPKQSELPLLVRLDVSPVIAAVSNELTTWARDLVDRNGFDVATPPRRSPYNGKRGPVFPPSSALVDLACYAAVWLADHVEALRRSPAAVEAHRGLTNAIATAEVAIDRPATRLFVGVCDMCGAYLYGQPGAASTTCDHCGAAYADVAERWHRALVELRGYPATAALIAGSIGELYGRQINRKLINIWHHRRQVTKVDDDPDTGDPRFRIGEVLDRAAKSEPRTAR